MPKPERDSAASVLKAPTPAHDIMGIHEGRIMDTQDIASAEAPLQGPCPEFPGAKQKLEVMSKFTVKLGTGSLSSPALLEKGRTVAEMLDNNAVYPTLQALLPALVLLCDNLEAANSEVLFNGGKVAHQQKRLAEKALRDALKDFAGYVQGISGGDKAKILSAGYDVVKQAGPQPKPAAPANLIVRRTDVLGMLKVKWQRVKGSKLYYLEMQEEGSTAWERVVTTTKTNQVMTGLVTGKMYSFRVQAITSAGISPMSEVAGNIAA